MPSTASFRRCIPREPERIISVSVSGVPRNFVLGEGGFQQIHFRTEDRENGDLGGGRHLVRSSGSSCNLVQEISYSKSFLIFGTLKLFMMEINLFVIANAKQLRT